jgi:hypothetical protein
MVARLQIYSLNVYNICVYKKIQWFDVLKINEMHFIATVQVYGRYNMVLRMALVKPR